MNAAILILIVLAAVGSGLIAGLFFTFSTFVMQALARLEPRRGVEAMQAINRTVMNPLTMGVFIGTAALGLASVIYGLWTWDQHESLAMIAGGGFYLASFIITAAGNVPMNDKLATMNADEPETQAYWTQYQQRWMRLNHARTLTSIFATAGYMIALAACAN